MKDTAVMICFQHRVGIAETGAGVFVLCVHAEGERFQVDNIIVEKLRRKISILLAEKAYRDAGMGENICFKFRFLEDMYLFLRCSAFAVNTAESQPSFRYCNFQNTAVELSVMHTAYAHLSSDFGSLISPRH